MKFVACLCLIALAFTGPRVNVRQSNAANVTAAIAWALAIGLLVGAAMVLDRGWPQ